MWFYVLFELRIINPKLQGLFVENLFGMLAQFRKGIPVVKHL